MDSKKRAQIRRTLRSLAAAHTATMELLEQTLALLSKELALDSFTFWKSRRTSVETERSRGQLWVDHRLLSVEYRGRSCFLGNTLPFRLLAHLARRPNAFVTYEDLFSEVWNAVRSDAAVRSVVKILREKLRRAGMAVLAEAIDGSVPGHYRLKLGD